MDIKSKPHYYFYVLILPIFSVCFFIACNNEYSEIETNTSATESDSLLIWIKSGQNQDNPRQVRKENLLKAYEMANIEKVDSIKLKYLSRIQWNFLGLADSTWFRRTNKETNALAIEVGDSLRLGGSYWDLAEFLSSNNVKDSAFYHFSKAQKIFNELDDNYRAGILAYDMARLQVDVKDYTGSEINAIKAIELLKQMEDNLMLYRCYNLLGIITKDLKEYKRSLDYYNTANSYLKKSGASSQFGPEIENNIGVTYQEMGAHDNAITIFRKTMASDSLIFENPGYYATILKNLAKSTYKGGFSTDAERIFFRSLRIKDSVGDIAGLAGGNYDLAQYYVAKKDTANAIIHAKKAKAFAEKSNNNERLLQSLELLTKLDPGNASAYGQSYIALNDSLQQEERKIRNKFARIRFETDEVVAENQLLASQKQLWTGIAASLFLLGLSIFVMVNQRIKNQKLRFHQQQQASNEKIFNLMLSEKEQFTAGKKLEQKRISEELHDGVLGKMLGARMVLTGLNKKAGPEAIAERADAIAALKDVEGEVRSISHELSHAAYQEIDNFIRSIQDLLKNISEAANINHKFNFSEAIDWDGLQGDIKINLYRMVQESLQNAVKHSKCNNIVLEFGAADEHLQIMVQDDGIGYDLGKRKKGIGMRNIQSRIEKLNGSWRIDSKSGAGTSVRFSIPIDYFSKKSQIIDTLEKVEKS